MRKRENKKRWSLYNFDNLILALQQFSVYRAFRFNRYREPILYQYLITSFITNFTTITITQFIANFIVLYFITYLFYTIFCYINRLIMSGKVS